MSQQTPLPTVYYSCGSFLVFDAQHALQLRRKRILSRPVTGGDHSGGGTACHEVSPYCISPYAAMVVAKQKLAQFKRLEKKRDISLENNRAEFAAKLAHLVDSEKVKFIVERLNELRRRNIQVPVGRDYSSEFDETKVRVTINTVPDTKLSSFKEINIETSEVISLIEADRNKECNRKTAGNELDRTHVYQDLYRRGFYISSGLKFGSDYLAYTGDPDEYHSKYAIRLVPSDNSGHVDLDKTDFNEINGLQRLTHTANKIPLFTTVTNLSTVGDNTGSISNNNKGDNDDNYTNMRIRYWTLKERVYLNPDSQNTDFDAVEPNNLNYSQDSDNNFRYNKVRKT